MPAVKLKQREPNGRHKRPSAEERKRREREAYQVEMRPVLNQPHRRGRAQPEHPWCVNPLGRFCLEWKVRRELHDCAADYAALVHRWRVAKGVPVQDSTGVSGSGLGPSPATVAAWERGIEAMEGAMKKCAVGKAGNIGYGAVRHLAVDQAELPPEFAPIAIQAMLALAKHMGHRLNHPFVRITQT